MMRMFAGLLISKKIRVTDATDPTLMGLSGSIVDETKNTLVVECGNSMKILPKSVVSFELKEEKGTKYFKGKDLIGTPQDRINKL